MKPTDLLSQEHRVIEQVLACLEIMMDQAISRRRLEGTRAREAVDFFRRFADQCHHAKEEKHLFPAMEAKGFPRQGGPTGVMLAEHDQGRACVRGMERSIPAASGGDAGAIARFAEHGRHYIQLLRAHMEKEDSCLFTMANQAFSGEDQRQLMAAFRRVEGEEVDAGMHEEYVGLAHRLAEAYGVARPDGPEGPARGCVPDSEIRDRLV